MYVLPVVDKYLCTVTCGYINMNIIYAHEACLPLPIPAFLWHSMSIEYRIRSVRLTTFEFPVSSLTVYRPVLFICNE